MSWFVVFLLFSVFAMMVGPILLMQPTQRDRKIAALRAKAGDLGLKVTLQSQERRLIPVYERRWPSLEKSKRVGVEWLLERQTYSHGIHFADWWQWRGADRPPTAVLPILEERLAALPESVSDVEATPLGLRCYWSEKGGEPVLLQLAEWLRSTAELMEPYILRQSAPAE
ncbi:MAG TPA: hypothetical protein VLE50_00490 [Cellvibrio sp.]|nr:hypothetical protein [Cellvibrio sp.]